MSAELEVVAIEDPEAEATVDDIRNYKTRIYNYLGDPALEIDAIEAEADLIDVTPDILPEKRAAIGAVTLAISREIVRR
jgi:hypothetical protein